MAPRPNKVPPAFCIFEYVYFARPDSVFEGMKRYMQLNLPFYIKIVKEEEA